MTAAAGPAAPPPPIDPAALRLLVRVGGPALRDRMIATFLRDAPGRVAALRAAGARGDAEAAGFAAHSLGSSAGQLGARAVQGLCAEAERLAAAGDAGRAGALAEPLGHELDRARACLQAGEPEAGAAPEADADRPRIGVVEDNRDNRLLIRAILEDRYQVDEYVHGAEALAGFAHRPPDLVLLDISLPGMDGLEVLQQLRADPRLRACPVIALTANAMTGDRERYLAAGFDDYVSKPLTDESILLDAIARRVRR